MQLESQRYGGRKGTRETATGRFWGTYDDIAIGGHHLYKLTNTLSGITIIIGNKQKWSFNFHKILLIWLQSYKNLLIHNYYFLIIL